MRILHRQGAISRAELTRMTGLNRSTVGTLTTDLVRAGLAREQAPVGRGVGRPSIVVAPEHERIFTIAFDVRVERTVSAVVTMGGAVTGRHEVSHARGVSTPRKLTRTLLTSIDGHLSGAPDGAVCLGIGIAVPGVVRHVDGFVRFAPNMGWVDVPLADELRAGLPALLPIVVGNDADMGAIAEHIRGSAAGCDNAIFLSGEVGVGGGIILGGRLMVGAGGYGGEIGHMVVNPDGHACRCGRTGCWETEIGEEAVIRALGGEVGADLDVLLAAVPEQAGDIPELREIGHWLGLGLANLVNIFNPEVVVFGGSLRRVFPRVQGYLKESFASALVAPREQVRLALPAMGRDAALLGAAESIYADLLVDPMGTLGRITDGVAA